MGSAGNGGGGPTELERGECGEKKEAELGLGTSLSCVVDLVGAELAYF